MDTDSEVEAAAFATGSACVHEARKRYSQAPGRAYAFFTQCLRRDDFTEISMVLRSPWAEELKAHGEDGLRTLCRLIARRSGPIEIDVALAKDAGFPLGGLPDVDGLPAGRAGYALVRARVAGTRVLGDGLSIVFAEQRLEAMHPGQRYALSRSYVAYDSYYRPWEIYEFSGTNKSTALTVPVDIGAHVEAQVRASTQEFEARRLYFVLMRVRMRENRVGERPPYVGAIVDYYEVPDYVPKLAPK